MRGIGLLVALLVLALLLFGSAMLMQWTQDESGSLPVLDSLPEFEFTESGGRPFGRADLLGRVSVVDFVFTRCKGPCPIMAGNMGLLYRNFESDNTVQFVSITVEPDFDSLDVLTQYAVAQGVTDDRWKFLWAPIDQVVAVCEQGFMLAADDLPGGHSTRFVLLDDAARIRGYYGGTDSAETARLQDDIMKLASGLK